MVLLVVGSSVWYRAIELGDLALQAQAELADCIRENACMMRGAVADFALGFTALLESDLADVFELSNLAHSAAYASWVDIAAFFGRHAPVPSTEPSRAEIEQALSFCSLVIRHICQIA